MQSDAAKAAPLMRALCGSNPLGLSDTRDNLDVFSSDLPFLYMIRAFVVFITNAMLVSIPLSKELMEEKVDVRFRTICRGMPVSSG